VDLLTGHLSGSAFSANCGWISLSNAVASVRTTTLQPGALAPNGLPIAWLLQNFGTTNISATADADGDGASNADEFHADTSPTKASSVFRITKITRGTTTPTYMTLVWNSESSRCYAVQRKSSLRDGVWTDFIALPFLGWSAVGFDDYNMTNNFYRVRAYRPVIP
jgi:hypothetical protein